MFGPWAVDTRLSVDATRPLLNHGPESPGLGAPTTHTESPVLGALVANDAELVRVAGCTLVLPSGTSRSSTRSVVLSRPTTRAACAMPSDVVTSIFEALPTSRSLVRISPERRTQTPDPRRVSFPSRALTATTEFATASTSA